MAPHATSRPAREEDPTMKLWIRVDAATPRDAAIADLADELKVPVVKMLGHVVALWAAMSEHAGRSGRHTESASSVRMECSRDGSNARENSSREWSETAHGTSNPLRNLRGKSPNPPRKFGEIPPPRNGTERNEDQKQKLRA